MTRWLSEAPGDRKGTSRPEGTRRASGRARALAAVALLMAVPAQVNTQGVRDLTLEELMGVDAGRVFGASERSQPVTEAPASVSFITAEEIEQYGYKTLADILRGVRGMNITNDRNWSWVGIRGFGKPGDYNTRILLMINNHRVNDNVFGQAEVGAEFGLDPAVIERIEVIRGPASSLYGESAVFAVINVITRTGASLDGTTVEVEASSFEGTALSARFGREFDNGVDLALSGTLERANGNEELYFEAFDTPETNNGIASNLDGRQVGQLYGRVEVGGLTVTGAYGTREKEVPTASFGTVFNAQTPKNETTDRHSLLDAEYVRMLGRTRLSVRGSWDRFTYDGVLPLQTDLLPSGILVGENGVVGDRWTVGARVQHPLASNQRLTAGVEYIDNFTQYQDLRFPDVDQVFFEIDRSTNQQAVYAQHELRIVQPLLLTTGLRYDQYERFSRLSPRAALIWMPVSNQSFKYLFGRAFRVPNETETNEFYYGESVRSLTPESIDTHEVVWERYTSDWLRTSVSAYWYDAKELITLAPDETSPLGATYANAGEVKAKGLEFEAQFRGARGLQGSLSYAVQEAIDQETDGPLPNSPRHMLNGRASMPISSAGSSVALEINAFSKRETVFGTTVDGAITTNLTVMQPLTPALTLYGTVRNLFDVEFADPVAGYHVQSEIVQDGRTWHVGLRWKLGSE